MYKCVLWAGSHLPLPKMADGLITACDNWEPIFGSTDEIPLFWWFLIDKFNCFSLDDGTPIFVVDRVSALARAELRYAKFDSAMLPAQKKIWHEFYERLGAGKGDIFNIQLAELWHGKFQASTENFNTYMKNFLLPLEAGSFGTRQQQEQRRLLIDKRFEQAGECVENLRGKTIPLVQS